MKADPAHASSLNSNIADAYIWLDDYQQATNLFKKLYEANPTIMHFRYGYGRALVYAEGYAEAVRVLAGVPTEFSDGGSAGEGRIFEAAARFGNLKSLKDSDRSQAIEDSKKVLCAGIRASTTYDWRKLIDSESDEGHFSKIRALVKPYVGACEIREAGK
jgi:tetratricopeptide (TPR) repeat protein